VLAPVPSARSPNTAVVGTACKPPPRYALESPLTLELDAVIMAGTGSTRKVFYIRARKVRGAGAV